MKRSYFYIFVLVCPLLLTACSATKFVPDGSYLLDEVRVSSDVKAVKSSELKSFLRQKSNAKWFSLVKVPLYVYSLSGRDSTKHFNRFLRKIGDAPVIYNASDAERSRVEMTKAIQNMGYMRARVECNTQKKRKKIKVHYNIHAGSPYFVKSIRYDLDDVGVAKYIRQDTVNSLLKKGMHFNINVLDAERQRITNLLLQNGYYKFNKDFITYTADTIRNTLQVDLTLHVQPYRTDVHTDYVTHPQYYMNSVSFVTDFDPLQSSALSSIDVNDSINHKGYPIYYKNKLFLKPSLLTDNIQFASGDLYNANDIQRTYSKFGRLSALKYSNIRFSEKIEHDTCKLDAYVLLTKSEHKSVSFEIEGTNSAGDLGAAASASFQHRNLFHGSETFNLKLRGAYEVISGLQGDYRNNNYKEYGIETSIHFPKFLFPFLTHDFKNRIYATTEFGLQYNYQLRPEFSRTMASFAWSYKWLHKQRTQHRFDLIDVAYLYLPWISKQFKDIYITNGQNHIFEYNYQNRLIVRTGYMYSYNSSGNSLLNGATSSNSYTIRFNIESAGNILYGISKAVNMQQNSDGEYTILNIPYAQYMKGEFDFAKNFSFDERNSLAMHVGLGVAIPYGNAKTIPFEKRYFSGGANSVRGWSVRELGPGTFPGDNNLLNQSGDIKLDLSLEYRTKLFWKIHAAAFIDAGNVWTIRDYENQPGGVFKFDEFYKQIAVAYGLGLRLDLDFLVLRFDGGMKAINPVYASGKKRYPIVHPDFGRDFTFHFAVGYPF